jgi:hypothetical protein
MKALLHPDRRETAAIRYLEPHELDAVGGAFLWGCTIDGPEEAYDLHPEIYVPDLSGIRGSPEEPGL